MYYVSLLSQISVTLGFFSSVCESRGKLQPKDEAGIASGMLAVVRFPPPRADRGWGARLKTGRRKGGDLGIFFVLTPQYSTQLEKETEAPRLGGKNWMA